MSAIEQPGLLRMGSPRLDSWIAVSFQHQAVIMYLCDGPYPHGHLSARQLSIHVAHDQQVCLARASALLKKQLLEDWAAFSCSAR